ISSDIMYQHERLWKDQITFMRNNVGRFRASIGLKLHSFNICDDYLYDYGKLCEISTPFSLHISKSINIDKDKNIDVDWNIFINGSHDISALECIAFHTSILNVNRGMSRHLYNMM